MRDSTRGQDSAGRKGEESEGSTACRVVRLVICTSLESDVKVRLVMHLIERPAEHTKLHRASDIADEILAEGHDMDQK